MGDLVGDAPVDLVAEAGEHGPAGRGDRARDQLGVEHGQFVLGSAATDDDDRVEVAATAERADAGRHHRSGELALDPDVAHRQREAERALFEFVAEVVPRRGADAGDHADPQRDRRQDMTSVPVEQPLGDEPAHDLVARLGDVAERVLRVDAGHLQTDASGGGVVVEVAEHPHLHAVAEAQPMLLQHRPQAASVPGRRTGR